MMFEINQGQTDSSVQFLARGNGYGLFLTGASAVLTLAKPPADSPSPSQGEGDRPTIQMDVLALNFVGANPDARVVGVGELQARSNYYKGTDPANWQVDVPNYSRVRVEGLYEGIDLEFYGNDTGKLEYDFLVAPNADVSQIRLGFQGAQDVSLDPTGNLLLRTASGQVTAQAPLSYQDADVGTGGRSGLLRGT